MKKEDFHLVQNYENGWKVFSLAQYQIRTKIREASSEFGIDGGKVSKLQIINSSGDTVASYGLGWDISPEKLADLALFHEFLNCFN